MKNHFIISYTGNKRQEVETIYKNLDFKNITTIIEPFCGSCALSYYISTIHPKKYKYILNDLDKYLIELINLMKDENKYLEFITKTINLCFDDDNNFISKEKYNIIVKQDNLESYFISRKFYTIRCGLYPLKMVFNDAGPDYYIDKLLKTPFINFVRTENILITNTDGIETYNKYKDDKQNLIFLDPPYMVSCNDMYNHKGINIYEFLYNNPISKEKAKIYLCLENMWIIKLLFKNYKFIEYNKRYEISKKDTSHILIENIFT